MSAQHTPGPWVVRPCGSGNPNRWNVLTELGENASGIQMVRTIDQVLDYCGKEEAAANARLIAAAPELKDVVRSLIGWLLQASPEEFVDWMVDKRTPGFEQLSRDEWKRKLREVVAQASDAIAKATGAGQ